MAAHPGSGLGQRRAQGLGLVSRGRCRLLGVPTCSGCGRQGRKLNKSSEQVQALPSFASLFVSY